MKLYILLVGFLWNLQLLAQNFSVQISTWKDDKPAAVSISFDDASFSQYRFAFPVLEKWGYKATFGTVVEWTRDTPTYSAEPGYFEIKKMGWPQIVELHKAGHEIASHGYRHRGFDDSVPFDSLVNEMRRSKKAIENHIGDTCYTLHYPYSHTTKKIVRSAREAGFRFARTGGEAYNSACPENMFLLQSRAILNDTTPSLAEFDAWIRSARGKWLILMYHHLFPPGSKEMRILTYHKVRNTYSLFPETFEKQMEILSRYDYWVAPIRNIGKYILEREQTRIRAYKCLGRYIIKLSKPHLKNPDEPLTLIIRVPWSRIDIKVNGTLVPFRREKKRILLNVRPGSKIIIKRKK